MTVKILTGDCRDILRTLPTESVHCVVTSPPYFGLRDYGVDGQIGLEPTPDAFVEQMVSVFREVHRVLRKDATLWLNLGDSYAGGGHGGGGSYEAERNWRAGNPDKNKGNSNRDGLGRVTGAKPKDLLGIPWRVAFAVQADGWYLRQDIIWHKPNPMPESIKDRCTKAHEYLFLMAKSQRYYFDQEAILEDSSPNTHARLSQDVQAQLGSLRANGGTRTDRPMKAVARKGGGNRSHKGTTAYEDGQLEHRTKEGLVKFADKQRKLAQSWRGSEFHTGKTGEHQLGRSQKDRTKNNESFDEAMAIMPEKRNKRSVWTVATAPFKEAHFATFPPDLIIPCILAGCPKGGTVLDPFGGAGTTGLVADRLQRNAILLELNPTYATMARQRIDGDAPLFAEATP